MAGIGSQGEPDVGAGSDKAVKTRRARIDVIANLRATPIAYAEFFLQCDTFIT
jgi:hypothetical protein